MSVQLTINRQQYEVDVSADTPLLWVLRDHLGLTGTKYGCGIAQCGACTVHLDGTPVRSCVLSVQAAVGKTVTTIEGLDTVPGMAVKQAWNDLNVVQCGFCQSGQIMSAAALLMKQPAPDDADINQAMSGNICRCSTYVRIRQGIHQAAKILANTVDTGEA